MSAFVNWHILGVVEVIPIEASFGDLSECEILGGRDVCLLSSPSILVSCYVCLAPASFAPVACIDHLKAFKARALKLRYIFVGLAPVRRVQSDVYDDRIPVRLVTHVHLLSYMSDYTRLTRAKPTIGIRANLIS
jgi:hypothetical protein